MNDSIGRFIKKITIKELFGLYDYTLCISNDGGDGNISILYGDNGSGKTTILKLVFYLLAPEHGEGHKTIAGKIPFRYFEIVLSDQTKIITERSIKGKSRSFTMTIKKPRKKEISYVFTWGVSDNSEVKPEDNKRYRAFLEALKSLQISLFWLSDDRQMRLAGDQSLTSDSQDFVHFATRHIDIERSKWKNARQPEITPEDVAQNLLLESIWRAESWVQSCALLDSSRGESNVNTLYNEILQQLAAMTVTQEADVATKKSIENRVLQFENRCKEYAKYGLMQEFNGKDILASIRNAPKRQLGSISTILDPYLDSIEKKLEALHDTQRRVDSLVTVINRFLTNKTLSYNLHSGFAVTTSTGITLDPNMFSSGERHLFVLFYNSIIAVNKPSIFMIDEPEISLNVKWQRSFLSSLQECIDDSPVQYILASHSIALIDRHRNRVIKLEPTSK